MLPLSYLVNAVFDFGLTMLLKKWAKEKKKMIIF